MLRRRRTGYAALERWCGFTLLEVLVALAIISVAVTAGAHLVVMAVSANTRARRVTRAAILAAQKIEELRSARFAVNGAGTSIDDERLELSPAGALTTDVDGYYGYFDATGAPVRSGRRRAGVTFVRRWSIARVLPGSNDVVAIQVRVAGIGAGPPDAQLTTIRVRRDE